MLCDGLPSKFLTTAPALIAKILSPATSHKDRTAKRELYQQQGVKWYLLVDAEQKTIQSLELEEGVYVERSTESGEITFTVEPGGDVI